MDKGLAEFLRNYRKSNVRLTPDLVRRVGQLVEEGMSMDAVCDLLMIDSSNYHSWVARGTAFLEVGEGPEDEAVCGYFVATIRQKLAEYRKGCVDALQDEENSRDWIRWLQILERRDKRTWSKYDPDGGTEEDYEPDERFL